MGATASISTTNPLNSLTAVQVADIVANCGEEFSSYQQVFVDNRINGHVLSKLGSSEDVIALLCSLGITNSGHQSTLSYRLMQAKSTNKHTSAIDLSSLTVKVNEKELTGLSEQGEHVEAIVLCGRTLQFNEKRLGPDHPDTLTTVNDLACLLDQHGR